MLDMHMLSQVYRTHIYQAGAGDGSVDKLLEADEREWSNSLTGLDQVYAETQSEWLDSDNDFQIDSGEWVSVFIPDQYDVYGHIVESHDGLGNYTVQYYGDNSQLFAYPDNNGEYATGGYFEHAVLTAVQKQIGARDDPGNLDDDLVSRAKYFESGEGNGIFMRMKEVYDPNRSVTSFEYDGLGRLTRKRIPVYGVTNYTYGYALDAGSLSDTNLNWIKTTQLIDTTSPNYKKTYAYFDGLGRNVLGRQVMV